MQSFDLIEFLHRQRNFSIKTFGPGPRTAGVLDHLSEEIEEVRVCDGKDLMEWVDLILLSMDGAYRAGFSPEAIVAGLQQKLSINEGRDWPDWRTMDPDKKIKANKTSN